MISHIFMYFMLLAWRWKCEVDAFSQIKKKVTSCDKRSFSRVILYWNLINTSNTKLSQMCLKIIDRYSFLRLHTACRFTFSELHSLTFYKIVIWNNKINLQDLLYCTVTIEKAAIHIVATEIRNLPHRETFSASSSCCINLWQKRVLKLLDGLC